MMMKNKIIIMIYHHLYHKTTILQWHDTQSNSKN